VQILTDINCFFTTLHKRSIQKQLKKYGHEPVSLRDIQDEIYDMVKPVDPFKITLYDLINSGHGETVTNILIDLNSFWSHENRESIQVEPSSSPSTSQTSPSNPSNSADSNSLNENANSNSESANPSTSERQESSKNPSESDEFDTNSTNSEEESTTTTTNTHPN
jgi:hypothetical protein